MNKAEERYIEREIWNSSKYWYCIIYKTLNQGSLKRCKLDASCTLHQQYNRTEEWEYVHSACYWGCPKLHVLIHTSTSIPAFWLFGMLGFTDQMPFNATVQVQIMC